MRTGDSTLLPPGKVLLLPPAGPRPGAERARRPPSGRCVFVGRRRGTRRPPRSRHTATAPRQANTTRRAPGTEPPRPAVPLAPGSAPLPKTKALRRSRTHRRPVWEAGRGPGRRLHLPGTPRANKAPPDLQGRGWSGSTRRHPPPAAGPASRGPAAAAPGPAPAAAVSRDGGPGLSPAPAACSPSPRPAHSPSAPLPGQALASAPHASCSSSGGGGFARSWDCAPVAANNTASHWSNLVAPPSLSKAGRDWTGSAQVNYLRRLRRRPIRSCAAFRPGGRMQISV